MLNLLLPQYNLCLQIQNSYTLSFINLLVSLTFTFGLLKKEINISATPSASKCCSFTVINVVELKSSLNFLINSNTRESTLPKQLQIKLPKTKKENSIFLCYPGMSIKASNKLTKKVRDLKLFSWVTHLNNGYYH